MRIIGIVHTKENLGMAYDIIKNYSPKKIMLESDPKLPLQNSFFYNLEKLIETAERSEFWVNKPGEEIMPLTEIIHGDIYLYEVYPITTRLIMHKDELIEEWRGLSKKEIRNKEAELYFEILKENYSIMAFKKRDEGLYESALKHEPDLVLVGAFHAINLKDKLPDANLELWFSKEKLSELLFWMPLLVTYSLTKKIIPKVYFAEYEKEKNYKLINNCQ